LRFTRVVPARTRRTLWLDREISDEGIALGGRDGISVELTADDGFVAERAMWWPGPTAATWHEAHHSPGVTLAGTKWALAEGEVGGARSTQTYLLIANTSGAATQVRAMLLMSIWVGAAGQREDDWRVYLEWQYQL